MAFPSVIEEFVRVSSIRSYIGYGFAVAFWLAYFYTIDMAIMHGQGLAVGWNLMPRP